jgi:hypothetical protein
MQRAAAYAVWACVTLGIIQVASAAESSEQRTLSEQDHRRLLDILKIEELRRGPDGDPKSPRAANFDETKVEQNLKLPSLLTLANGRPVTTADQWWKQRRPELVELFDREIYGRVPRHTPKVTREIKRNSS